MEHIVAPQKHVMNENGTRHRSSDRLTPRPPTKAAKDIVSWTKNRMANHCSKDWKPWNTPLACQFVVAGIGRIADGISQAFIDFVKFRYTKGSIAIVHAC